jgi:hypothetical protein
MHFPHGRVVIVAASVPFGKRLRPQGCAAAMASLAQQRQPPQLANDGSGKARKITRTKARKLHNTGWDQSFTSEQIS